MKPIHAQKLKNFLSFASFILTLLVNVSCKQETIELEKAMEAPRMVVSHYMEYQPMYGIYPDISVSDVKKEILDAHDQGVDAFQINIQRPNRQGAINITAKLYQAASECSFPFFLFPSADNWNRNPRWTYEEILEYMLLYADHPNQLKVDGRPLFTSWLGQHKGVEFWHRTKERLKEEHGIEMFYVPFHAAGGRNRTPGELEGYLKEWEGVVDGYWHWGAASSPFHMDSELYVPPFRSGYEIRGLPSLPLTNEHISSVLKEHNMPFMAPIAPAFWAGCWESCRYTEHLGGAGIESQWMSVINNQDARWVNLVTWNDMGEDTHWSPHPYTHIAPNKPTLAPMYSHAGYAELNKYYIEWWKNGRQPAIENDKIFYAHRNQFSDAIPLKESCPMECSLGKPDVAYVTTMLVSPARLTIQSGPEITEFDVPAGISHWDGPLGLGEQRFILGRGGKTIIEVTSRQPVVDPPEYKSWSFYTGYAEAKP